MTKPVIPRAKAREDVDGAIDYYATEAGADIALAFVNALEEAYDFISVSPAAGSPRWSHGLHIPSLRTMRLKGFPWLVFYLEIVEHVDVWRVLHAQRDIPSWISEGYG